MSASSKTKTASKPKTASKSKKPKQEPLTLEAILYNMDSEPSVHSSEMGIPQAKDEPDPTILQTPKSMNHARLGRLQNKITQDMKCLKPEEGKDRMAVARIKAIKREISEVLRSIVHQLVFLHWKHDEYREQLSRPPANSLEHVRATYTKRYALRAYENSIRSELNRLWSLLEEKLIDGQVFCNTELVGQEREKLNRYFDKVEKTCQTYKPETMRVEK